MTDITYSIVEHDGGWALQYSPMSFPKPSRRASTRWLRPSAPAAEQEQPGETEAISYQDEGGDWHEETAGGTRPSHHPISSNPNRTRNVLRPAGRG